MNLWHRMRSHWKSLLVSTILFLSPLLLSLPSQAAMPKLTIGYVPVLGLTPALVARSLGLYRKEGLNVRLVAFESGPALYQAMAGGRVQMAYAGVPALLEWGSRGLQVQAVAKVEDGVFNLVARKGYHGPIRGSVVGDVGQGSGQDVMLRGFLLPSHHLATRQVKLRYLPQSDMLGALASGQLGMALLGAPLSTLAVLKGARVVASVRDPGFILLATRKLITSRPKIVAEVIRAHRLAINYVNHHPQQAADILAKALQVPAVTAPGVRDSAAKVVLIGLRTLHFSANFTAADFSLYQKMNQRLVRLDLTQHTVHIKRFFDLHWAGS